MNGYQATGLPNGLTVYDPVGQNDWPMPTTTGEPYVWGYDSTNPGAYDNKTGDMGYMPYANPGYLGNYDTAGDYQPVTVDNLSPPDTSQITLDSDIPNPSSKGYQVLGDLYDGTVQDNNVASIPIPSEAWLLGSAFIVLLALRKKFRK
jgi:hypothetical protein